jgi:hypothetical protein
VKFKADNYLKRVRGVNGWFSQTDVEVFTILLELQAKFGTKGDILEIGTFEGKSSILLGSFLDDKQRLHICDTFDIPTEGLNEIENLQSYPGLTQERFIRNYRKFHSLGPIVYKCKSTDLGSKSFGSQFRFIHIDGSHLYENVKFDISLSVELLSEPTGILVLDDYRAYHSFGVALAVWELISKGNFVPVILTQNKIYLVQANSRVFNHEVAEELRSYEIDFVIEKLFDFEFYRVVGSTNGNLYRDKSIIREFIPPILLRMLRRVFN